MRIVFLGNFGPVHSTESHHRWTWQKLGHEVISLQENTTSAGQLVEAARGADLVQVTHTHTWGPRDGSMEDAMAQIKAMGVPTMSYHLDYYHGLDTWDKRASRVGQAWDWKVDYFFSTDGGHEEFFKSRGVNHRWKRPGVVEYGIYEGVHQSGLACDVGFAGSINYHPEHGFRGIMVEALRARYGQRFRVFQGCREQNLNNLYASVKVLAGDHCFAGTPRYWSDRAPETCGRGGFIVYPRTEGLEIPVASYEPQNVKDLIDKIDYYLEHEEEREAVRKKCFEYVKEHDSYTVILKEILKEMGL